MLHEKTTIEAYIESFCEDYPPEAHGIIALVAGPAPSQYDLWGKPAAEIRDWCMHVHVDYADQSMCNLPMKYKDVPVMVFFDID